MDDIIDDPQDLNEAGAQLVVKVLDGSGQLKELQKQVKEVRDELNTNKQALMDMMRTSGTNQLRMHGTLVRLAKKRRVKQPTIDDVIDTVETELRANEATKDISEDIVDNISNTIESRKEVTEVESLTLVKAK